MQFSVLTCGIKSLALLAIITDWCRFPCFVPAEYKQSPVIRDMIYCNNEPYVHLWCHTFSRLVGISKIFQALKREHLSALGSQQRPVTAGDRCHTLGHHHSYGHYQSYQPVSCPSVSLVARRSDATRHCVWQVSQDCKTVVCPTYRKTPLFSYRYRNTLFSVWQYRKTLLFVWHVSQDAVACLTGQYRKTVVCPTYRKTPLFSYRYRNTLLSDSIARRCCLSDTYRKTL